MYIKVLVPNKFQFKAVPTFKSLISADRNEVHYIGGADVLPPPLSAQEEAQALKKLDEDDGEAKSLLIEHNLRLVVYIAKKFDNTGVGVEDLISIGTIGLIKAVNSYDSGKNIKLATYASRCIENEILMYLRRNSKTRMEVSIDEPLNVDWDGNELLLSDILVTERERQIVDLRFGLSSEDGTELTQKEVADMLGISQSYISRLEKKIIKRLKKEIVRYE